MSTRSDISIIRPNGTIQTQYIHMDGYLSGNGKKLYENYKTKEDAELIFKVGEYGFDSSLPTTPSKARMLLKAAEKDGSIKKISNQDKELHFSTDFLVNSLAERNRDTGRLNTDLEYHYLYAPDKKGNYKWNVIDRDGIKPLTKKMIEEDDPSHDWCNSPDGKWFGTLSMKEKDSLHASAKQIVKNLKVANEKEVPKAKENKHFRVTKSNFDREAWKKQHQETVSDMKNGLLKEVENYTADPKKVLELLNFTSKFHKYSTRNAMLIHYQRPAATAVGSYKKFKDMGYHVNKGEKGMKVFVPTTVTSFHRKTKDGKDSIVTLRNATKAEKEKIKSGQIKTSQQTFYKIGTVFDAPQTNMPKEKYPELYPNRHVDFDMKDKSKLKDLEKGLKTVAKNMNMPVVTYDPVKTPNLDDPQNAKGYFDAATNEIVLNQHNTPTENVTVLAHELGHAQLHNSKKQEKELPRSIKEMQAELTSYQYSKTYGIDTKDETVDYIASWTDNGKKFNELPVGVRGQILTHVNEATKRLTNATDKVLEEQEKQKELDKAQEKTQESEPSKKQDYRYYSIHRPIDFGTYPRSKQKPTVINNFKDRKEVGNGIKAWGYIEYQKPLSKEEADSYELVSADKTVEKSVEKSNEALSKTSKTNNLSKNQQQAYQAYLNQQGLER